MSSRKLDSTFIAETGLLVAIEIVMKLTGLGSVPVGPLYMSFLTVPIAIAAMMLGPAAGAITGAVFGLVSFYDAVTGVSLMTGAFFQIDPFNTFMLCVVMRILMGTVVGFFYRALRKGLSSNRNICYLLGSLSAPLLNTFFFMGYICLVFYQTDYVQNLVTKLGAANPVMFVILLVGMQGLIEAVVCGVVGTVVARALDPFLARQNIRRREAAA